MKLFNTITLCLIACIALFGCKEVLTNCILIPKNPQLEIKELIQAQIHKVFKEEINVDVSNASPGEYYVARYKVNGQLPTGIEVDVPLDFDRTYIILTGTPFEKGSFEVELEVWVSSYASTSQVEPVNGELCTAKASRTYTIEIND